jgi:hypothetical protein
MFSPDRNNQFEKTPQKPKYRFMITRHADRTPAGQLTPSGIEKAEKKGVGFKKGAEIVKGYSSDEKTDRAYKTAEYISAASETKSELGEQYNTRRVPDIQYEILNPDLGKELKKGSEIIEIATLTELNLSTEKDENGKFIVDLSKLPEAEQIKIGPIRQKNQSLGFKYLLDQPAITHRLAIGLANQLVHEFEIAGRYDNRRKNANNSLKKDAVLNTLTHGLLLESLLKEAGVVKNKNGELIDGINNFESEEFGGYLNPAESIYIDVEDPNNLPELLPVAFEGGNRPVPGTIFVSLEKLKKLAKDYQEFKETRDKI